MSQTINFGIDLGTTNSLIARYQSGKVEVFKNPISLKDTLPSVVAFRRERTIVGDKARELVEKDSSNVFSLFKRKMGTSESFKVPNIGAERTPIELSALVLREMKNFVYTGETIDSVVITIPASFDTIQSNATKKAGYEAGFKEVVLLQEPIAASLAFANKQDTDTVLDGQWLVYDLGGGTFDVALVQFSEGEMKVVDHEGDNFLGGLDFDTLIIERLIVPHLLKIGHFVNLETELKAADGRYNRLYQKLKIKAEDAKIQLSSARLAEIEFEVEDTEGDEHEVYLTIHRSDFENIIRERTQFTIDLVKNLLTKNNLQPADIEQVVLVGGSTYIPLVRQLLENELGIKVNQSVDPTTAVAIGAAYYAGSKTQNLAAQMTETAKNTEGEVSNLKVRMAYQKAAQEAEEYFTAAIEGNITGMNYRIIRQDGGFDSGMKTLTARIEEMLPLVRNELNVFTLKIYDNIGNPVAVAIPEIQILHGKFSIYGQPLPNDICIEIDDFDSNLTKLEVVFEKNSILPLKKTFVRTVSKTISRGSAESIIINVLEGSRYATPAACLPVGVIEFKGADLTMSLVKGSDIEITLEISESRDLKIMAVLLMTDQEISDVFSPSARTVHIQKLRIETDELHAMARKELRELERTERYDLAGKLNPLLLELDTIRTTLATLPHNDTTDTRYQLEERKRRIAQNLDALLNEYRLEAVKTEYFEARNHANAWIIKSNDSILRGRYDESIKDERAFLATNNTRQIKSKINQFNDLAWQAKQRDPSYLVQLFNYYAYGVEYPQPGLAAPYIETGERAIQRQNFQELLGTIYNLHSLLPPDSNEAQKIRGTGVS